jgi:hypothetical protein
MIGDNGFLQHFEHGSRVLVAQSHRHRFCVNWAGQRKQGGGAANALGKLGDDRHILLPGRNFHGRRLINAFDHHRRPHLKHPRAAGARADHVDHYFWIEPGALRQNHCLGGSDVVYGYQMISDEFHPAAVTEASKIGALLGEVGEQIHALCNGIAVAAGVDDEIANLCLRPGSAQGTVERDVAGFLEERLEVEFVGDAERREFDHNSSRLTGIGDSLRDILDRGRIGKAGHDDGRIARQLADVAGDCDIGQRKFGSSCGVDIKADDVPFPIDKIARNRAAHDAKPDDSNGLVHERSFLPNSIDGQRRARLN